MQERVQKARKLSKIQHDKALVEDMVKRGVIHLPHGSEALTAGRKTQFLLTNYAHNEDVEEGTDGEKGSTNEEKGARTREEKTGSRASPARQGKTLGKSRAQQGFSDSTMSACTG
jgi:hypothetical protein